MKNLKLLTLIVISILTSAFVVCKVLDWKVKDDYVVKFKFGKYTFGVDSMPSPNHGTIKGLHATIHFDPNDLEKSHVSISVEAKTIETGEPLKNASATGPDVLIAPKFPLISFKSTSLAKTDFGYEAVGNITIKDISKEIRFPFTFKNETFDGGFTLETKDFKFTHPHVPKEISVFFTIPVTQ